MLFASSAHDAGRRLSRHQAIKLSAQTDVREKLKGKGLLVFSFSNRALQEEIPEAYKNIDDVVDSTIASGISQKVARLRPLVVIKGSERTGLLRFAHRRGFDPLPNLKTHKTKTISKMPLKIGFECVKYFSIMDITTDR